MTAPTMQELLTLELADRRVATLVAPVDYPRELSPRPFLHPVRTLDGAVVTDERPEDHAWHLGVSVALQDVGGTNYWGGRTYLRDQGYTWRDDHGEVRFDGWDRVAAGHASGRLVWRDRGGGAELVEQRSLGWRLLGDGRAWELDLGFELRNVTARGLDLGSPGSNGRPGGGYGGFFWRLPPSAAALHLQTPAATGEEAVHGQVAPWLLVRGTSGDPGQRYSLVFHPGDEASARDPWFVRAAGYPGVGSALAWSDPVHLAVGAAVQRRVRVIVVDGDVGSEEVPALLSVPRSDPDDDAGEAAVGAAT